MTDYMYHHPLESQLFKIVLNIFTQDQKNRRQVAKCMSGKTIDDKFNNLLDVVMRNCDHIHALYRASSRERIPGAEREGEMRGGTGVPGRRSSSQSRSRRSNIPLATAAGALSPLLVNLSSSHL